MRLHESLAGLLCVLLAIPAVADTCSANSNGELNQAGCETLALVNTVKFYELGVCTASPQLPANEGDAVDLSKCQRIYRNSAGFTVDAKKGVTTELTGGTSTEPTAGTYAYSYMILDPIMKVQAKLTFASDQTVTDINGAAQGSKGSGKYCWTLDSTVKVSDEGTNYYRGPATVDCGTSFPSIIGNMTEVQDSDADSGTACGGKYVNGTLDASQGWFCGLDSNLKRKNLTNSLVVQVLPITFTHKSGNNIDIKWDVSNGASIGSAGPGKVTGIGVGPLGPTFSDVSK